MLKLEYIPKGSKECPLLILYGKDPSVISELVNKLRDLAENHIVVLC